MSRIDTIIARLDGAPADAAPAWTPPNQVERALAVPAETRRNAELMTDVGNAARFVLQHGANVKFCHRWGQWLIYTGKRWEQDERGEVVKRAKRTALSIFDEARLADDDDRRKKLAEFAVKTQRRERLAAMIELSKPDLAVTPNELDADAWLLNCQNGTVDLRAGALRPHSRDDLITKCCRASFRPGVDAPTFQQFRARIFRTHPGLIDWLQKAIGYSATGSTSEQVLFFLYGTGANGKTTLLDALSYVLGDYAGKADRDLLTHADGAQHPTSIADLLGRRLVTCSETNEGRRFDEARLKDLVGETRLKARFMRMDFFEFDATHKIWLYSNHRPVVRGTDHGFWRRMRLVPFIEVIGPDERDPKLPTKLQAEADGILTWIVAGAVRWQAEGLGCPNEVTAATNDYRVEMDSIGAFIDDACIVGDGFSAMARDLYGAYSRWCIDAGEKPLSQKRLGMALSERGMLSAKDSYTALKKWSGIGLRASEISAKQQSLG